MSRLPPCVLHEDDDLLAVNKPAGLNTHSPNPHAGEGLYEWLRNRAPRWRDLGIMQRLDKETSGVLLFTKTPRAHRSLSEQFAAHRTRKTYLLWTDRPAPAQRLEVESQLRRAGEKRRSAAGGDLAITRFQTLSTQAGRSLIQAEPITGRTHQIRAHAAESGFPILGDTLYGGSAAERVYLHAFKLTVRHPDGRDLEFCAPLDFEADRSWQLRRAIIDLEETNAFRLLHGAGDGWPEWHLDRLGDFLLSESPRPPQPAELARAQEFARQFSSWGMRHKLWRPAARGAEAAESCPQRVFGADAPAEFEVLENGVRFLIRLGEGGSTGLFLDQRDNRRRLLTGYIGPNFPALDWARGWEALNTFAYACAFSVCAARAGMRTTSIDLSKKYLDWGRRNFQCNGLAPADHDFIFGDAFDWLARLWKKGRQFDLVMLDPPTFSQSKPFGRFQAERDYRRLIMAALRVLRPGGIMLACANTARWPAREFVSAARAGVQASRRKVLAEAYFPQPPDFPIGPGAPGHLKSLWLEVG